MKDFSQRLGDRMKEIGYTQASLARELRTHQSTVLRWLNGSLPRGRMMEDLCVALNTTMNWLVAGKLPIEPRTSPEALSRLAANRESGDFQKEIDALYPKEESAGPVDPQAELSEILTYCNSLFGLDDPSPKSVRLFATAIRHHARRVKEYLPKS